jgi:hypothetical protein
LLVKLDIARLVRIDQGGIDADVTDLAGHIAGGADLEALQARALLETMKPSRSTWKLPARVYSRAPSALS